MELPPPHVLAQLDAIIVGQESIVAINGDLQTADEDDDRSVSSEALGISSSETSFSEDGAGTTSSRFCARRPRQSRAARSTARR